VETTGRYLGQQWTQPKNLPVADRGRIKAGIIGPYDREHAGLRYVLQQHQPILQTGYASKGSLPT
jgi:hypothetical protein